MVCKYCGYEMIEGLVICPNCLKNIPGYNPLNTMIRKAKTKKIRKSNKKNDEINQWYDMGLF